LGDVPTLGNLFTDFRKPQATTPAATTAFEWDTAGVAVKESGLTAPPPPQEPASRPTATVSKGLETRERFDALDVESQVVAGKDSDSDEARGNRTSGRQMEGAVLAGELAPLPIEFPAASRKNEPRAAVAKTPAPERPAPTAGSGPAAAPAPSQPSSTLAGRSIQDLNGIELEPLPIKFPAPTLKGTPSELPSGPNIEPLTDTPAGTRIVGLPDDEAKSAARPPATPAPGRFTPAYITDQATREESKLLDLSQVEAFTKHLFAPKKESSFQILVAQAGREAPGSVSETDALRNEPTIVGGARNTMATETAKASQRAGVKGSTLFDFSVDGALKYQWGLNGRTVNDGTVTFFNGVEGKKADMWMDLDDAAGNFQLGLTAADRSGPALNLELADRSFFARAGDQPAIVGEKVLSESLAKQRGEAGTTLRAKLKVADAEGEELAQRIAESEEARRTGVTATKGAGVVRKLAEIKDAIASTVAGTKANEAKAEKAEGEKRLSLERERVVGAQAKPAETAARGNVYSINAVGYLTTNALVSYDGAGTGAAASRPASEVTAGKRVDIALPAGGAEVGQTETFGRSYRARGLEPVKLQDGELKVASAPLPTPSQPAKSDSDMRPLQRSTNAPIPQPEVLTRDNAFSTFSLNVSDVSFKLAAASLEKGAMPDVATVRSEEFINAFDYRDPEPTAGAPIAFAWERARYPFAHNRDLLRFSVKTAASGRQPGRPLNLVLLLDNSGSMERADRVRIIQECLLVLAGQLQSQDCVSVVTFARTPRLWADGVPGNQAASALERVGTLTPEGGTNLEDALNLAYQTARRHFIAQGVNRVVLLTDGAANLGNVAPDALKQKVESFRQQGLALDCFGIGWEGFNDDLLELLSRNGDGRYGFVNTPEEAATEFAGQLAGALKVAASDVKVQVEFNPRRVTAYRQIGYAKHQLKKEQFRDNTVDAAEIGAAEAGNALYVVEVDPRGEGPLAIVRVRYKVPGTADYREHEWPVPFTGVAVPLEQASPALRLAATASAFSEWLVASPYAGDVAPDRLLSYLRGVPEVFGVDPRPKKLEWMIRQAKSIAGK
jgi:Mg-chelatase subunit ChlD